MTITVLTLLLLAAGLGLYGLHLSRRGTPAPGGLSVSTGKGTLRLPCRKDGFGCGAVLGGNALLAVAAEPVPGIAESEAFCRSLPQLALEAAGTLGTDQMDTLLPKVVHALEDKGCASFAALLAARDRFHWLALGDIGLFLFREGYLVQLNLPHTGLQQRMPEILEFRLSPAEALTDPQCRQLTGWLGKKDAPAEASLQALDLLPGDRLLMLSADTTRAVSEAKLTAILKEEADAAGAAARIRALHAGATLTVIGL